MDDQRRTAQDLGLVSLGLQLRPVAPALDETALGDSAVEGEQDTAPRSGPRRLSALAESALHAASAVNAAPSLGTTWSHVHPLRCEMLAHATVQFVKFCVDSLLRPPAFQLVTRSEVDKARVAGQPRVDLAHA